MNISLKTIDDRPKVLWRMPLYDSDENKECLMKDTPLEFFICPQVKICKFQCLQKLEQRRREEYVREQQLKLLIKVEHITHNNGNNRTK
jgi:hypothetical protein